MKACRILVVGGGSTGLTAALSAREQNESASVTILSKERLLPYRRMALPYFIQGKISKFDDIAICSKNYLVSRRINFLAGMEVKEINTRERVVEAIDLKSNEKSLFYYDSLIMATGGQSFIPPIEGIELKNVFALRTMEDAQKIAEASKSCGRAVVAGGGLIALKVSEALIKSGTRVTLVCRSRILRRLLEPELSSYVQERLEKQGVECIVGKDIEKIEGSKKVESVKIDGKRIDASMVIFATGTRPSVDLAEKAGLKIGKNGINVDRRMLTSSPGIFAAGDCAESFDKILGKYEYIPVGSVGAASGRVAGINAAGGDSRSNGFVRAQTEKVFDIQILSIGHTYDEAKKEGLNCKIIDITTPSAKNVNRAPKFKVVLDGDGKIIGAQAVGVKIFPLHSSTLLEAINSQSLEGIRFPLSSFIETEFLRRA